MHKNQPTILAINPGTRYMGIAVLKGSFLLDWAIKVISGRFSTNKLERLKRLVSNLVAEYHPDILAIKKLLPSRSSENLNQVAFEIEELARSNRVKLVRYSIQELESFHSPYASVNRYELSRFISQKYPVLLNEFSREEKSINPYHIRVFEAVALAAMAEAKTPAT